MVTVWRIGDVQWKGVQEVAEGRALQGSCSTCCSSGSWDVHCLAPGVCEALCVVSMAKGRGGVG